MASKHCGGYELARGDVNISFWIIRASWNHVDRSISFFQDGGQSLSQAVASLIMRRFYPCRDWSKRIVNDIVKLGERIQDESLKHHHRAAFSLSDIVSYVEYRSKQYTIVHTEFTRLVNMKYPMRFFRDLDTYLKRNHCFIINIPYIVAIWHEDNKYFMYDPNKGNLNGGNRCHWYGAEKFPNITCFHSLKDLSVIYSRNISCHQHMIEVSWSTVSVMDVFPIQNKKKGNNSKGGRRRMNNHY